MKDQHSIRKSPTPPDACSLINNNGQFQMMMAFRQGRTAEMYVRFRQWCWLNDVNPTDVFNALIEPITHFCENFARRDEQGNIHITFNLGDVMVERFYQHKYPHRNSEPAKRQRYAATRARKIQLI